MGHAALTVAEYFRDDARQDVLLLIDNIFRFIQAGSEVSGLLGRLPSRMGYQPTMGTGLGRARGTHLHDAWGGHHLGASRLRSGGRLHGPGHYAHVRPSVRAHRALPQTRRKPGALARR